MTAITHQGTDEAQQRMRALGALALSAMRLTLIGSLMFVGGVLAYVVGGLLL